MIQKSKEIEGYNIVVEKQENTAWEIFIEREGKQVGWKVYHPSLSKDWAMDTMVDYGYAYNRKNYKEFFNSEDFATALLKKIKEDGVKILSVKGLDLVII